MITFTVEVCERYFGQDHSDVPGGDPPQLHHPEVLGVGVPGVELHVVLTLVVTVLVEDRPKCCLLDQELVNNVIRITLAYKISFEYEALSDVWFCSTKRPQQKPQSSEGFSFEADDALPSPYKKKRYF